MAISTDISWCDSTVNAQMGCMGCELLTPKVRKCYAALLTEKYAGNPGWPTSFGQPVIFPERIEKACKWSDLSGKVRQDKPWLNGLPRIIFLNDMGDTFTEKLPIDWLMPYIPSMEASSHIWMILTKRPKRMVSFFYQLGYVPNNFWLGASITDQQTANARIPELIKIENALLFLSVEPQIEPIDFGKWITPPFLVKSPISYFINGGESGPNPRSFDWDWARSNYKQCGQAGVAFFFKQGGGYPDRRESFDNIPEDLQIRQMPIESKMPSTQLSLL